MAHGYAALVDKVHDLKKSRGAVILAHNYALGEVQDIADFVGGSLELVRKSAEVESGVVVMCAVHCIAETAAILCPDKAILLPDSGSLCPMANMITADELRTEKASHPGATVVCYLNSPAEAKAESDICCTADNAVRIVAAIPETEPIMFVPDQYLGDWVSTQTGRDMTLWPGYCPTHSKIMPENIVRLKTKYPEAKVLVHPECSPPVIRLADAVLNTGDMVRYPRASDAKEFIIGTDVGILHRLRKDNPDKVFVPASELARCGKMKLTTVEAILWALEDSDRQVKVPPDTAARAKKAIDRMFSVLSPD